ncbi:hypothetical protein [Pseudoalteromonas byunsanensis]|uniref:Uncharacterized protein n=1 Tax=Pseudoalteromonas byunsanensis TaxID=327939 RepID=A0A1S1NCG1_9GAMM|nr:hypothetical protein [Pseudoalteromonas byunsanensis]OHU97136.1 hypothetical protein BIW53_02110 [Pseudoalteromonas byunsanensis]
MLVRIGKVLFAIMVLGVLLLNTFLLDSHIKFSKENQKPTVVFKEVEIPTSTPTTSFFFRCLEYRRPQATDSYAFNSKENEPVKKSDVEACKQAAIELAEK